MLHRHLLQCLQVTLRFQQLLVQVVNQALGRCLETMGRVALHAAESERGSMAVRGSSDGAGLPVAHIFVRMPIHLQTPQHGSPANKRAGPEELAGVATVLAKAKVARCAALARRLYGGKELDKIDETQASEQGRWPRLQPARLPQHGQQQRWDGPIPCVGT